MLSVIVPAYNLENYIEECIQSICTQTYSDIEIIVINDGSVDKTGEICDRLNAEDKRIHVIHQSNKGVMAARIRGVNEAKGKWISFVDGDDYLDRNMYSAMLSNCAGSDLITCGLRREEKHIAQIVLDDFAAGRYEGDDYRNLLACAIYDFTSEKQQRLTPWLVNKIFRTDVMKEVAKECRHYKITYAEDSVMLYRYLLKCKTVYICKDVFYTYRYREESAIHSRKDDILIDINQVYIALKDRFEIEDKNLHLIEQLQKWIVIMTGYAFRNQMKFNEDICPIEFLVDVEALTSKRVVIYGAGKCGRDYVRQLRQNDIVPVLWVDRHPKESNIHSPESLKNIEFDCLIIAVNSRELAEEIKKDLLAMDIGTEKIHWRKPVRLY